MSCHNIIPFLGSTRLFGIFSQNWLLTWIKHLQIQRKMLIHLTLSDFKETALKLMLSNCHILMRQSFGPIWSKLSWHFEGSAVCSKPVLAYLGNIYSCFDVQTVFTSKSWLKSKTDPKKKTCVLISMKPPRVFIKDNKCSEDLCYEILSHTIFYHQIITTVESKTTMTGASDDFLVSYIIHY